MSQQETKDMAKYFYRASASDFMKIPGSPVAYWISPNVAKVFESESVKSWTISEGQNKTANNDRFVRNVWEVSIKEIGKDRKWLPYAKGGDYRKWYGNREHLIDWSEPARQHYRKDSNCRIISDWLWFRPGITWTLLTSSRQSFRLLSDVETFDMTGSSVFVKDGFSLEFLLGFLNSKVSALLNKTINPTLALQVKNVRDLPIIVSKLDEVKKNVENLIALTKDDWDSFETSIDFESSPLIRCGNEYDSLRKTYEKVRAGWLEKVQKVKEIETENNRIFIDAYGLADELTDDVPADEITLTRNPSYRYGNVKAEKDAEIMLQCDSLEELISYAVGCIFGRYSINESGLVLADQRSSFSDFFDQISSPGFIPDDDAILPLTDQEWFADDATNRVREFIRVVWGDELLQDNLDFVAESLCLHAIKPKRGESALDTIRRYLSTQFYKDHLRTYKKRPIYWLFSSGKHKAFECLVYLHRYNEGMLARMRTEYVIPLSAKLNAYAEKLEQDKEASTSAAETKRLEKEIATLHKQQAELAEFDEKLRHYADQRISLDLDDGVKVNYGKFGDLLAEVKAVTGQK